MKDLTILMDTTLGRPADILERLEVEGVEVRAGCLFPRLEGRVAHVAVSPDHVESVRRVVAELGATVADEREVLVIPRGTRGTASEVARKVADAGAVVWIAYFGAQGEMFLGTSDLELARTALGIT